MTGWWLSLGIARVFHGPLEGNVVGSVCVAPSGHAVPSTIVVVADARNALPGRLAALVFVSSGGVLVLEIVGLRLVAPYVGVTLQTSSAIIGVALAAIAYGAWFGGFLADRVDPRRVLAPALLLAAGATALTLPMVRWAGEWLRGAAVAGVLLLAMLACSYQRRYSRR
jgi:predicted MFS family arabinose efflux permease